MNYKETIAAYTPIGEQEEKDKAVLLSFINAHRECVLLRAPPYALQVGFYHE